MNQPSREAMAGKLQIKADERLAHNHISVNFRTERFLSRRD